MAGKLRIPRKFTKFTLVDTSDVKADPNALEDIEAVSLHSSEEETTDANNGCFGWVKSKWYWKQEREKKNHARIVAQIETIGQKIDTHEATMVQIQEDLRKCKKTKNKQKARLLILKRKRLGNTIQAYYNSRNELEQVLISLEESSDQVALVKSYKTANTILKTTMRQRGGASAVETYEDLADDLDEAKADVNELQEVVSRRIGYGDDELQEELDELFEDSPPPRIKPAPGPSNPPPQLMERQLTDTEILESLPTVPVSLPEAPNGDIGLTDEEALRELEAPIAA
jgi:hypothetical protein